MKPEVQSRVPCVSENRSRTSLYLEYKRQHLLRVASAMTRGTKIEPEDLVQELCKRFLETGNLEMKITDPTATEKDVWNYCVNGMRQRFSEMRRNKKNHNQTHVQNMSETPGGSEDKTLSWDPVDRRASLSVVVLERRDLVATILQNLSEKERKVVLHYMNFFTFSNALEELDMPDRTAQKVFADVRERLKNKRCD